MSGKGRRILWSPQPRQAAFMARGEYEALYGGAAGGGKSDALLCEALRQVHVPGYRGLILRKTAPQLTEIIDRSRILYQGAFPKARYHETARRWTFPSGAKIFFGTMQHPADRVKYQGQRYDYIAFDELTHFTWQEYSYMFSRNRPSGPGTVCYIRAATNPGGVGHGWVKDRFVTPAPPMTPLVEEVRAGEKIMRRDRVFIPAQVTDNPALLENAPDYLASLALLPEAERRALLEGSWDSFSGQVFTEWRNDPAHYQDQRWTHVVEPFAVPAWWRVYRGFDFGFARPYAVGWYALDGEGRLYRIRELYGCTGEPNAGVRQNPAEIAKEIRRVEAEDENLRGRVIQGVADPSIFDESRGESVARMMERERVFFAPGDNTRLPGKMQLHYRLAFGEEGRPMLQVFSTCRHFIRTVPALTYSQRDVEDVDTAQEDHIYDECRYVLMGRRMAPRPPARRPSPPQDDPLDLRPRRKPLFYRI